MHTADSQKEANTEQSAAQQPAAEQAVPPFPLETPGTDSAGNMDEQPAPPEMRLKALAAENEALRKENQELLKRCESFQTETAGKTDDTVNQLNELKTALTDRVYLLVCAYEETIEKIDALIESLPTEIIRDKTAAVQAKPRAGDTGGASRQTRLSSGDSLASKAADTLTEEKKVSIIETLKNNSKPAEPVKPAFGVTHKERANAKNLLKKYSKIK